MSQTDLDAWMPVLFGFFIVLFLIVLWLHRVWEKKRSEALADLSLSFGLHFSRDHRISEHDSAFKLFQKGHACRSYNSMTGCMNGLEVSYFDYQFTTSGGKNSHTYKQTVAFFRGKRSIPEFLMEPEHLLHRIGSVFGFHDIDFPDFPQFSKKYSLKGKDEVEVRRFFSPDLIQFFELHLNWNLEVRACGLIMFRFDKRVKPDEFAPFIQETTQIAGRLLG